MITGTIIGVFAAPILWVMVTRDYVNSSDWATMELRTRDVFSLHPPLIGAYSRYGWSHPGPLPFYAFAVPYRLFGESAQAMQIAALLINAIAIGAIVWLLARRGRAELAAGILLIAATLWAAPPESMADSWNASIVVLPFVLTLIACWCAHLGDEPALAVATTAFLFVFQAHVGFGIVLLPLFVTTVTLVTSRIMRTSAPRVWIVRSAFVAAVLSVPVVVDMVINLPGNLPRLVGWSLVNDVESAGIRRAAAIIGRQSSLSFVTEPRLPRFLADVLDPLPFGRLPGVLLVLLALSLIMTLRRRLPTEAALVGGVMGMWIVAFVAVANVRGPQYEWLFGFLMPLAWTSWAVVALVAWRLLNRQIRTRFPSANVFLAGSIVVGLTGGWLALDHARDSVSGGFVWTELVPPVEQFASVATNAGLDEPVLVEFGGDPFSSGGIQAALVNQLDLEGIDVEVQPDLRLQFGDHRVVEGRPGAHLLVQSETVTGPTPPGATVLSVWDSMTAAERAETDQLTRSLTELLAANGQEDKIPLLDTSAASLVLYGDPPAGLVAHVASFDRLSQLRSGKGVRFILYQFAIP